MILEVSNNHTRKQINSRVSSIKMHKYHLSMIIIGNKSVSLHYETGKNASFTH